MTIVHLPLRRISTDVWMFASEAWQFCTLAELPLLMAVRRRRPREKVLVHSNQATQYGSDDWHRFCLAHNLDSSMSRRGNCWERQCGGRIFLQQPEKGTDPETDLQNP